MPRIAGAPPSNPPPPPGAAPTARPVVASGFTDGLDPMPRPAAAYGATLGAWGLWHEVRIDDATSTGGPSVPAVAEAGKPFRVNYGRELADLGQAGELKTITLKYQVDGGPVRSKRIADGQPDLQTGRLLRTPARIDVPATARGELQYWFELGTKDGRKVYDSEFGRNYRADILPAGGATLRFDDLWGDAVSGPIQAGGTLRIAYDVDRLKQFLYATNYRGTTSFSVNAFVSFDGRPPTEVPLVTISRGQFGQSTGFIPLEAAVAVPEDARSVGVWFRGSSYGGSVYGGNVFDSRYGSNYNYPVVPTPR